MSTNISNGKPEKKICLYSKLLNFNKIPSLSIAKRVIIIENLSEKDIFSFKWEFETQENEDQKHNKILTSLNVFPSEGKIYPKKKQFCKIILKSGSLEEKFEKTIVCKIKNESEKERIRKKTKNYEKKLFTATTKKIYKKRKFKPELDSFISNEMTKKFKISQRKQNKIDSDEEKEFHIREIIEGFSKIENIKEDSEEIKILAEIICLDHTEINLHQELKKKFFFPNYFRTTSKLFVDERIEIKKKQVNIEEKIKGDWENLKGNCNAHNLFSEILLGNLQEVLTDNKNEFLKIEENPENLKFFSEFTSLPNILYDNEYMENEKSYLKDYKSIIEDETKNYTVKKLNVEEILNFGNNDNKIERNEEIKIFETMKDPFFVNICEWFLEETVFNNIIEILNDPI